MCGKRKGRDEEKGKEIGREKKRKGMGSKEEWQGIEGRQGLSR